MSEERIELAETAALSTTRAESVDDSAIVNAGLPRGAVVGRYLILGVRGTGGMGIVYEAYDPELDRKLALKIVRDTLADAAARTRMLREAQAIARLSHPNVVAVHDVGSYGEHQLFVAMELVDGETVTSWLREAPRTNAEILDVFVQAGRGLAAAHAAALVHRDVKPDNVLVGRDGRARVVDFGLVRELPKDDLADTQPDVRVRPSDPALSMQLTQVGAIMGTPYYMAPEQFARGDTDARTDQYSFCVSLFEALSGKRPYEGTTLKQVADKVLAGDIPELQAIHSVPAHVRAAIRRGMSVDPDARFPSMEALLAELTRDPAQARRRWLVAGGLAAGAAAVIALVVVATHRPAAASPCGGGADAIAQVWGPAKRAALERAFAATGAPFASTEVATVAAQLDAYAAAWARTYDQSCRATHERGEQSQELLDRRSACLRQRQAELGGVVDIFASADAATVRRAHATASDLSPISDCDDLAGLQALTKEPSDPATRAALGGLRDEVGHLAAALSARKPPAVASVAALVDRAHAVGWCPLEAEVRAIYGRLLSNTPDRDHARTVLVEAFTAATSCHYDKAALRAAVALVGVYARRGEFESGRDWLAISDGLLLRANDPPADRATQLATAGYLMMSEGKWAAAAETYERVLALREHDDPRSLQTSVTLSGLAHVYDELGRYAEARALAERSLAIQLPLFGEQHPDIAILLVTLGNIADDQGDGDAATRYYTRALAIREALHDDEGIADIVNNLGIIAQGVGRYAEALAYHRRALALRERIPDDNDATMSHTNIGDVLRAQHQCTAALGEYETARTLAEQLGAEHPYVGDALVGLGTCKLELGDIAAAGVALDRALAIRRAGARPIELADVELPLARVRWAQRRHDEALALARQARDAYAGAPHGEQGLADAERWLAEHAAKPPAAKAP